MRGKIIDFEGIDGAGKSTQADLLLKFFKKKKLKTSFYKFPQYTKTVYGKMVGDYLQGKFGQFDSINPHFKALPYALDRKLAKEEIENDLKKGKLVIIDRYVSSSTAHLSISLKGKAQKDFISWQRNLEYEVNKVPKEDLVILLNLPVEEALKLMSDRKKDLHEKKTLQINTRQVYLELAKNKNWLIVSCLDKKGNLRSKIEIHQDIVENLQKKNII